MKHVCVIAEAGVNHNGDPALAMRMVDAAKAAGADYIKFQTFVPEKLVSRFAEKADYQKRNTGGDGSQLEMLRKLALSREDFRALKAYCTEQGIGFLSTPFDRESIEFLEALDMELWKLPSGEITNLPYLEAIARTGKRVIMSTGMSEMFEIKAAIDVLERSGVSDIVLLHCNTQYPTPYEAVNLRAMATIARETGKPVGYSDHTLGIEVPIAAVAMGASVIEKHFTLDRRLEGPDHVASLEPDELAQMVRSIRNIEIALGSCEKRVTESERTNMAVARKSIVAACSIRKGDILNAANLTTKRPGSGISPMRWNEVIGTRAVRDFSEDEVIEL